MNVRVRIPGQLYSYTGGQSQLDAEGGTLGAVLDDLDRQHPGLRFRVVDEHGAIRPHVRFFVNREVVRSLSTPLGPGDEVVLVGALSGG